MAKSHSPLPGWPSRPDCGACAKFGGCLTHRRWSHVGNADGPDPPRKPPLKGPGVKDCTWSATCSGCTRVKDGDLTALRRQRAKCADIDDAPRFLRTFFGGDWMSIAAPLGIGPPSSKSFCIWCLAQLNETNIAGVPHGVCSKDMPSEIVDPRLPHIAEPALRGGSLSIQTQATAYLAAVQKRERDGVGKKVEPADYQSCIAKPLIWCSENILTFATTPLHFNLGTGLQLINLLEMALKRIDYSHTEQCGRTPDDQELAVKVKKANEKVLEVRIEFQNAEATAVNHAECIKIIEATAGSSAAVQAAAKPKRARPLPLENEYREHKVQHALAMKLITKTEKAIEKAIDELIKVWSGDRGSFEQSFYNLMQAFNFQRQVYHSGALNGNDIHRAFKPKAVKAFSDLLRPRLGCSPVVKPCGGVSLKLFFSGNNALADDYFNLFADYSEITSLHSRLEPVCPHELTRFSLLTKRFSLLFAKMFPGVAPTPKMHGLLVHAKQQLELLGAVGPLSESVVEGVHVQDNMLCRRFANVNDLEQSLRCRVSAMWQLGCPAFKSVRDASDERAEKKRRRVNQASRKERRGD